MYEKKLWNDKVEVHTTKEEFTKLYKEHTIKELAEIYGIPIPTIVEHIKALGLKKNKGYTKSNVKK